MRTCITRLSLTVVFLLTLVSAAGAQGIDIKGYGLVGGMSFAASESFDAVLDTSSGVIFGGGAEVGLPWGGLYFGVGAWRFSEEGERVFVSGSEVFPLGIPLTIEVTPIEVTGGWRFKNVSPRFVPYVGGGLELVRLQGDFGLRRCRRRRGRSVLGLPHPRRRRVQADAMAGRRRRARLDDAYPTPSGPAARPGVRRDRPGRRELSPEDQCRPLNLPSPGGSWRW